MQTHAIFLDLQDFQGASSAAAAKAMRAELAKLSSQIQDEEARKVDISLTRSDMFVV